jgi:hypothetical protein
MHSEVPWNCHGHLLTLFGKAAFDKQCHILKPKRDERHNQKQAIQFMTLTVMAIEKKKA